MLYNDPMSNTVTPLSAKDFGKPINISVSYLAPLLDALPMPAEITVTSQRSTQRLMARDLPKTGRRFTNLTTGFEVFDIASYLNNFEEAFGPAEVLIDPIRAALV